MKIFSASPDEIKQMMASWGHISVEPDKLVIHQYLFEPSQIFGRNQLLASDILTIDLHSAPPTLRVGNELVFISAMEREKLAQFASAHHIPVVKRPDIWDWLLEPYLDTDYTDDTHQKLMALLAGYGLTEDKVAAIRDEIDTQMYKYNFDTMLWEWAHLGAVDVLCAMRPKYTAGQFADFYQRVMAIALLPDQ